MIPFIITTNFLLCIASQIMLPTRAAMATGSDTDKLSLLALKDKLINGNPKALPSWNDSIHFCKWEGVTCNLHHMRVSSLNLTNQNLAGGTLAPELGNLTFLKMLNLWYNGLSCQIPKQIGHLKRLQFIDLRKNNLKGEVPPELANCSKLEQILFSYNNLIGKIPFWFGSMPQLTMLRLGSNKFHGNIPPSLGNLSSLERLSLPNNNLEGSIPQSLGQLSNLHLLYLAFNNFSGVIPPSFFNLSRMEYPDMPFNNLSGTIPSNIDHAFPYLKNFNVGYNLLTGTIPASLSNISQLQEFSIFKNAFTGPIPTSFGRLQNLQRVTIDHNNFGGGHGHDLDFFSPLTNYSQLYELQMTNNGFSGVLPKSIVNFSSQLLFLSMGHNSISGSIPEEIGQLVGLILLNLESNFLQSTIPHSIGKLENIGEIFLEESHLSGQILDAFGNLTRLFDLQLSGNNLEGTVPGSFRYCKGMQFLYLDQNSLSGNVPNDTFGHQESLIILNMTSNSLTGPLPSEFGKLENLVELHLGENKFTGDIPMELGECLKLTDLDMRGNYFQGSIPSTFSSLKSLQNLDLSNNNLSGTILHELKDLPFLETLNLSYNHFHGEVPKGGLFDNVTAISLIRNDNLCDGIPQLELPTCSNKSKEHSKITTMFIVISGVFACSVIFLMICLRRKQNKLSSSPSMENTHLRVSYRQLHKATNGFSSSNLIGIGSFGFVYRGILLHFEKPIAVKVLNLQMHGATKNFIAECKALSKVRHRNILNILTSCSSVDYKGDDFKALVFEFMPNGSLEKWLSNGHNEPRNLHLNFTQRLDIAIDVAHALDYFHHDFGEAIVHCDIKPSNILLDEDMVAHLGDFGLARLLHEVTSYSGEGQTASSAIKGTIGYIAPEYGEGGQVTIQGDMYSYGVLMLEMLTGKKPTDDMFHEDLNLPTFCKLALPDRVLEIVDSKLLVLSDRDHRKVMQNSNMGLKIQESLASFARIGVACCAELPGDRIGIKDVLAELLAIKRKLSTFNIVI